jgi:hypothetical protein
VNNPLQGGRAEKMRFGILPSRAIAFSLATASKLPTTSSSVAGLYFSTHGRKKSCRICQNPVPAKPLLCVCHERLLRTSFLLAADMIQVGSQKRTAAQAIYLSI